MKSLFFAALAATVVVATAADKPAGIPGDYKLLYEQNFDRPESLQQFVMTDSNAWKAVASEGGAGLALTQQSKYKPAVRSPVNIALVGDKIFGDFTLDVRMKQTGREYGHRDMCIFFGFEDPKNFYYAHIATAADDHAHNIFVVDDAPRTKIASQTTKGVNWGLDTWHTVRLERRAKDGTIKVYFDDLNTPIMVAENKVFPAGYLGFGSFDDTGMIDDLQIWGPSVETKAGDFFKPGP